MTDIDTTNTEAEPSAEVEQPATTDADAQSGDRLTSSFWQRPLVEQFLVPIVLPVAVILGVVVYILNLSRLLLSAHGHIPVIIGTVILLVILVGAAILSAAPRMRHSSLVLITAGFVLALSFAGWISLGHSEEKNTGPTTLPATTKANQKVALTEAPGGQLTFSPKSLTAKTGLAQMNVDFGAPGHTFAFHEATTLFAELKPAGAGPASGVAFFGTPGDYTFFCTIPGHEAAGMSGVVHVTGPPVALPQALSENGNAPGAAGGK